MFAHREQTHEYTAGCQTIRLFILSGSMISFICQIRFCVKIISEHLIFLVIDLFCGEALEQEHAHVIFLNW